jgi:hypothetical protein
MGVPWRREFLEDLFAVTVASIPRRPHFFVGLRHIAAIPAPNST